MPKIFAYGKISLEIICEQGGQSDISLDRVCPVHVSPTVGVDPASAVASGMVR